MIGESWKICNFVKLGNFKKSCMETLKFSTSSENTIFRFLLILWKYERLLYFLKFCSIFLLSKILK